jgi:hypothetical protein
MKKSLKNNLKRKKAKKRRKKILSLKKRTATNSHLQVLLFTLVQQTLDITGLMLVVKEMVCVNSMVNQLITRNPSGTSSMTRVFHHSRSADSRVRLMEETSTLLIKTATPDSVVEETAMVNLVIF